MDLIYSIGFLVYFLFCFVGGFIVSAVRFYKDTLVWKKRHPYVREITMALILRFFQAGLSILGIAFIFMKKIEGKWLDTVMLCTLQLFVGANLFQTLYGTSCSRSATWIAYSSTLWFSLDIAFSVRTTLRSYFDVLSRASIASFALLLIWCKTVRNNMASGRANTRYTLWLQLLVGINAAALLCQVSGAICFYAFLLANKHLSTTIRQSIIMACILLQVVYLSFFAIKGIFERCVRTENIDLEEARSLTSHRATVDPRVPLL